MGSLVIDDDAVAARARCPPADVRVMNIRSCITAHAITHTRDPPTPLSRPNGQCTSLNIFGLGATALTARLPRLEVLSASSNHLTASLFAHLGTHCPEIRELYLRGNAIAGPLSLLSLLPPTIRVLWMSGNPIAALPGFRRRAIAALPLLERLDAEEVTPEERRRCDAGADHDYAASADDGVAAPRAAVAVAVAPGGSSGADSSGAAGAVVASTGGSTRESHVLRAVLILLRELSPEEQDVVRNACVRG